MASIASASVVFTAEDHGIRTGLGASVAEWMTLKAVSARLVRIGVDSYQSSGAAADLLAGVGLDSEGWRPDTVRAARLDRQGLLGRSLGVDPLLVYLIGGPSSRLG